MKLGQIEKQIELPTKRQGGTTELTKMLAQLEVGDSFPIYWTEAEGVDFKTFRLRAASNITIRGRRTGRKFSVRKMKDEAGVEYLRVWRTE